MYPDGMSTYAPEIRGIAQSNALVTVTQNNSLFIKQLLRQDLSA
ncbi:fimbria/pilus outer membrane usher protein [Providencia hangzhouensis]